MDYEAIKRQLITSPVDAWGAILREHFPEPTPAEQGYKDALAARPQLREPQAEASGELWEAGVGKLFRKEVIGVFILGTRKIVAACGLTHADDEKESIANALEIAELHNARPTQAMDRDYLIRPELSDLGISDPDDPDVCIYDKSDEWVATVKDYATAQAIIGKLADETEASGEAMAWLGYVDQGMGHGHFEIAEPNAINAFPVYARPAPSSEKGELERAFAMLTMHGVPKERAKTVANGIDVLMTRVDREIKAIEGNSAMKAEAAEKGLGEAFGDGYMAGYENRGGQFEPETIDEAWMAHEAPKYESK